MSRKQVSKPQTTTSKPVTLDPESNRRLAAMAAVLGTTAESLIAQLANDADGDKVPSSTIPGLQIVVQFHGQSWRYDVQDTILRDAHGNWYLARGKDGSVEVDEQLKPLDEVRQGEIQQVTLAAACEQYFLCSKFTDGWTGSQDDLLAAAVDQLKAA